MPLPLLTFFVWVHLLHRLYSLELLEPQKSPDVLLSLSSMLTNTILYMYSLSPHICIRYFTRCSSVNFLYVSLLLKSHAFLELLELWPLFYAIIVKSTIHSRFFDAMVQKSPWWWFVPFDNLFLGKLKITPLYTDFSPNEYHMKTPTVCLENSSRNYLEKIFIFSNQCRRGTVSLFLPYCYFTNTSMQTRNRRLITCGFGLCGCL